MVPNIPMAGLLSKHPPPLRMVNRSTVRPKLHRLVRLPRRVLSPGGLDPFTDDAMPTPHRSGTLAGADATNLTGLRTFGRRPTHSLRAASRHHPALGLALLSHQAPLGDLTMGLTVPLLGTSLSHPADRLAPTIYRAPLTANTLGMTLGLIDALLGGPADRPAPLLVLALGSGLADGPTVASRTLPGTASLGVADANGMALLGT
jgi:hypothetical protein